MINLLPPQYKEELKKEEIFRIVLILGTIFVFFLTSLILVLFAGNIYVKAQADSLKFVVGLEEEKMQTSKARELKEKIIEASQTISKLDSFYKSKTDSTQLLETIFQAVPQGVSLTSVSWQKVSGRVVLAGFSPTREVLLGLKNNLEAQDQFSEVDFPPQNWVKPTDILFQASFKVNERR